MEVKSIIQYVIIFLFGLVGGYLAFNSSGSENNYNDRDYSRQYSTEDPGFFQPEIVSVDLVIKNGKIEIPDENNIQQGDKLYSLYLPAYYPITWGDANRPEFNSNVNVHIAPSSNGMMVLAEVDTDTLSFNGESSIQFSLDRKLKFEDHNEETKELEDWDSFTIHSKK